jgi:hypothetical protein
MTEYSRTGKVIHLRAFIPHCRGIEARLGVVGSGGRLGGGGPRLLLAPGLFVYGFSGTQIIPQKGSSAGPQ